MTSSGLPRSSAVLVVDDAEGSRHVFASWLRRAGYTVFEAGTGAEALELVARTRFELVVLDVHLPDMSGLDVCEHIKSGRSTSAIPVLHVSATATGSDDRSAALNRGADGYLIEPIERDELLANVTALLRYHDARRTSERLAARLQRLHESTLLMNAASTLDDLALYACTGLAAVFGLPAAIYLLRDRRAISATVSPNDLEPSVSECTAGYVLSLAREVESTGRLRPSAVQPDVAGADGVKALAASIITPRGESVGIAALLPITESPDDALMLDHFSQALAVAFENQRLYSIEHQMALTLQRAMLPKDIPHPVGIDIAVRYHASSATAEVGGDFYDAIEIDDHTTLIAVGDVAGHSLYAATVMAELRYSMRALVSVGMSASHIVSRLGAIMIGSHPNVTATLCLCVIDIEAQTVSVTNAGHLPPLLMQGARAEFIAEHGALLGLLTSSQTPTVTRPFSPGATLVLYTDGLIERRAEDLKVGLDALRAIVETALDEHPEPLCDRLLATLVSEAERFDDIALLVAQRN